MKKIAIIEDDQAIAQMYRIKFENEGYQVETAENGVLGLELCEKMRPDIVLLDIMMPEMNGDEMLAKMRDQPWGKHIKVLVLTNVGEQELPKTVHKLGVLDIILKASLTPRQVAENVASALGNVGNELLQNNLEES